MSTSYTKFILFLTGIMALSSPSFAQSLDPAKEYLNCSTTPGGVPVGVVILGMAELQKKDKLNDIQQIIDKENKESKGKLECVMAGYQITEAQTHCPTGQYWLCGKNSVDSPNPNSPNQLGPNAPRGNEHGYIEITPEDAKHGLRGGLEREGFYKGKADPTNYAGGIKRDDGGRLSTAASCTKDCACIAYNAKDDFECGRSFHDARTSSAPLAPAVHVIQKQVADPNELYTNKSPQNPDYCTGTLTCERAEACKKSASDVFIETCGGANCTPSFDSCTKDYDNFCKDSGQLCDNQIRTTRVPPPNMVAQANTAIAAIDNMRKVTENYQNINNRNLNFINCGVMKIESISVVGQPLSDYEKAYKDCVADPQNIRRTLRETDLNYLEKVLKAFADPTSYPSDRPFRTDNLQTMATALSKFANTPPQKAFQAMGINNPTEEMINAYQDLANAVSPLVGTTATKAGMNGTVLGFAIDTNGGKGYLGMAPASLQGSSNLPDYNQIIKAMGATENPPACLLNPTYNTKNQKTYAQAILRDHALSVAIRARLAQPDCIHVDDDGGANFKAKRKSAK